MSDLIPGKIKSQKSKMRRQAGRVSDSTFERIYKYYFDRRPIKLHPSEEKIRERWDTAWRLMTKFNTRANVVRKLTEEFSVHRQTAYNDIKSALKLFGDPEDQLKAAHKSLLHEYIVKGLKKAYKSDDLKAYEKMLLRYARLHGLDKDVSGVDYSKLQPVTIVFGSNEEDLKKQADDLMSDVPNTEDVNFEVVDEKDQDTED